MNHSFKNLSWSFVIVLTIVLFVGCQTDSKHHSNIQKFELLNVEFDGIPARAAVKKILSQIGSEQQPRIIFPSGETAQTPIHLFLKEVSVERALKIVAQICGCEARFTDAAVIFSHAMPDTEVVEYAKERALVREAVRKKRHLPSDAEIKAAQVLLRKADAVTIGGVYFGGTVQEENHALVLLVNSPEAERRLRQILPWSTPAGQAYILAGLNHLNRLEMEEENDFLESREPISLFQGGCVGGVVFKAELWSKWIRSDKLYTEIQSKLR